MGSARRLSRPGRPPRLTRPAGSPRFVLVSLSQDLRLAARLARDLPGSLATRSRRPKRGRWSPGVAPARGRLPGGRPPQDLRAPTEPVRRAPASRRMRAGRSRPAGASGRCRGGPGRALPGGVYLTAAEFSGRAPLVRGGETLAASLDGLRNPVSTTHLRGATSGSGGRPFTVPVDLANIRDWAVNFCLLFEMLGPRRWRHARWSLPGGDGLAFGLLYAGFGAPLDRWFTPVDPAASGVAPATSGRAGSSRGRAGWWACRSRIRSTCRWTRRSRSCAGSPTRSAPGDTPHLVAYVSPALRLCEAAERAGRDLRGAHIRLVGEPVTAGRLAAIRRAGPEASPDYGAVDVGLIGSACRAPTVPDEIHLWDDLLAVIQRPAPLPAPVSHRPPSSSRPSVPRLRSSCSTSPWAIRRPRRSGRADAPWSGSGGLGASTPSGASRSSPRGE